MDKLIKPSDFFAKNAIFGHDEFVAAHTDSGRRSKLTSASVLKQHVAAGNLLNLRRGLYATVPRDVSPESVQLDPYLLASKLTKDAVVAYHAALQFHGKAYSIWRRFHYLTRVRVRAFIFRDQEFIPVQAPASVRLLPDLGGGISEEVHEGSRVRVTTLERTLVDVLDSPGKCGGWEEVWRSLESIEFFDLDEVIDYARKLGSALTAARVGFFLEQNRDRLIVEDRFLELLRALKPVRPVYIDSERAPGKLVKEWNLIVPERILTRAWAQVA